MKLKNRIDLVGDSGVPRNADLSFRLTWTVDGVVPSASGHVLEFLIYQTKSGDQSPLVSITSASSGDDGSITIPNPAALQAYFVIRQEALAELKPGLYHYYIRDTFNDLTDVSQHGVIEIYGP